MNIKQAKEQIKHTVMAYLRKDELGEYRIPLDKQRPVYLLGAPGIGKTAIMEQITQETGISLVSYAMTHHTRQSALGLPLIARKTYGSQVVDVSEYTMSEIIATVYDTIEETGIQEGILFLDEINCVSETLNPAMLQFLQFKTFGRHRLPRGWVVVTAGNPPEYNKAVREFDIVTMDRLKRLDIEPDYPAWKEYAYRYGVHGAIMTYLDLRQTDFYIIESSVEGKRFVTARGWEDLSRMILLFEEMNLPVDQDLVIQYLQNRPVAREFAIYYDLYCKYRADYQVELVLAGQVSPEVVRRAESARLDERLSLLGLLLNTVGSDLKACLEQEELTRKIHQVLLAVKPELSLAAADGTAALDRQILKIRQTIERGERSGTLMAEQKAVDLLLIRTLESYQADLAVNTRASQVDAFSLAKNNFDQTVALLKQRVHATQEKLHHLFAFVAQVFGDGHEMLALMTELTINYHSSRFISRFGCDDYYAHNQDLMLLSRQQDLLRQLADLEQPNLVSGQLPEQNPEQTQAPGQ